jgi:hypothetical protein
MLAFVCEWFRCIPTGDILRPTSSCSICYLVTPFSFTEAGDYSDASLTLPQSIWVECLLIDTRGSGVPARIPSVVLLAELPRLYTLTKLETVKLG